MSDNNKDYIVLKEQGSFMIGGRVVENPGEYDPRDVHSPGQTLHGDHAYVFYQIPADSRKYPLVFLHGNGQSKKTWESTPDGREGFQNIFLKRGFSVYLPDQPRRGEAGRSCKPITIPAECDDQATLFDMFRIGRWPEYFDGVQFSRSPEALNQLFRAATPNTGEFDLDIISDAYAELAERLEDIVLVTHSRGGGCGWATVMKSPHVRGVVSFEPGSNFVFPEGECPPKQDCALGPFEAREVPLEEFLPLTKIPIVIYYADNIPEEPVPYFGQDMWRVRRFMAREFVKCINRHGGDARFVSLPEIGIHGNTHLIFSDKNNLQIADLMSDYLKEKKLDIK